MTDTAGTEHSGWGLWTTWRGGPDRVARIVESIREHTRSPVRVRLLVGGDERELQIASEDEITKVETFLQRVKGFRVLDIASSGPKLAIHVGFIRRSANFDVGANDPRRAWIRRGVLLEVTSADEEARSEVGRARAAVAAAIELGRPKLFTRAAVEGQARRPRPAPGDAPERAGSASGELERYLRKWPPPNGFPWIFLGLCLLAYAGVVAILALGGGWLFAGDGLELENAGDRLIVAGGAAVVAVASLVGQSYLFPAVEVATLTNARRVAQVLLSSVTLSGATGLLVSIPWVQGLFS